MASQIRLMVCSCEERSYYAFECPRCHDEVTKPADSSIVDLLISAGVVAHRWVIPPEALELHRGGPITADEVLDFALSLDRVDLWVAIDTPAVGA